MRFSYRALDANGNSVLGTLRAVDRAAAQKKLENKNLTIIFLKRNFFKGFSFEKSLTLREKANFCFCLFQLLKAGVPMHDALSDLAESSDFSPLLQEIFSDILSAVESGAPLSKALQNFPKSFDSVFVALIAAGEASGELPLILERLHKSLIWQETLAQRRQRLLIYPSIVSILVGSATLFLMIFLVPQLKNFVANMGYALPWYSRALFSLSDFFQNFCLEIAIFLIFLGVFLGVFKKFYPLFFDFLLLKIPIIGRIFQKIALARFLETLALLYSAGIPILESLSLAQGVLGNRVLLKNAKAAHAQVSMGESLSAAFHNSFPPLLIRMLSIAEKTGELDSALLNAVQFYERDILDAVERLHVLIEPILTLILGSILAWVMLSVLDPIYQLVGQLQ